MEWKPDWTFAVLEDLAEFFACNQMPKASHSVRVALAQAEEEASHRGFAKSSEVERPISMLRVIRMPESP
jgi:hypothetical protein